MRIDGNLAILFRAFQKKWLRVGLPRIVARAALAIALFVISGCEAPPPPAPDVAPPGSSVLGPGDRLRVIVFDQSQLGGEFQVGDDGDISVPLVGRFRVAGLVPATVEKMLRDRLAHGILTEPQVAVEIVRYRPVYVVGEVRSPGAVGYAGKLLVIDAVALAGGYTYRARTDRLRVLHADNPKRITVPATDTTTVGPGDVIYVPERWF